jgi:PAS domain S-box-containing protein
MIRISTPTASSAIRSLHDMLDAIDRAESSGARAQVAADLLHDMGYDRVVITLRDASLNPIIIAQSGTPELSSLTGLGLKPLPGAVWRRRLSHLERFRVGDLYLLDGSDDWVAREFFGAAASAPGDGTKWLATDLLVAVMRGPKQEVVGTVKLSGARDGRRPSELRLRDISAIVRHLTARVAYDALEALALQRHERLTLLQEAGASLTRSLDEQEIMRELARQVQRALRCDGVAVLVPDLQNDTLATGLRLVRGVERPRGPVRLGEGLVAEVARTGRPVRVGDREADRAREKAGLAPPLSMYDIVGESGVATSVVAVPIRVGIRLLGVLAVHSTNPDMYTAEDEEMLATMASQAATAIANARRHAESERERRTTEALADVARAVGESLRLGEVLRLILRHAVSLLNVEGACIALRTGDYLHIVAAIGSADVLSGVHLPVNASLIGRSVQSDDLILVNEFGADFSLNRSVQHLMRIQRTVIAPFITGRGTIGAIAIVNRDRPFDAEDAKVLQRLADQVSVAIVNARLFEEIEKATREWKVAFDSTANGIVVLEESLTVSRCNTRAAELCGFSIPGLLGRRFREALVGRGDSEEGRQLDAFIARALSDGVPVRETVRDMATGRLFSLLAASHPDGGCVITFDDVTETARLAEQHRKVLDTVSDAIIITSLDGRIIFANPAAHDLVGRQNLVGALGTELVTPPFIATLEREEQATRGGETRRYECEVQRADGTTRVVQLSSAPLYELQEVTGTVSCLRDVTAQRADAQARHRSEELYQRLVENATDAIFTADTDGRFTSVNAGFLKEVGLERDQVLGQHYMALIDPIDRTEAEREMRATLAGERRRVQLRYLSAQGSRLAVVTSAPLLDGETVIGVLGIVRDITTDEIKREATLQQARLAAVGQSLGRVANELNNPLASLLAVAELQVASSTLNDDDRRAVVQIAEEARRASQIVGQLLDTTGEAPQLGGTRAPVDLNAVLRRALDHHGYTLRALEVSVRSELAPVLRHVRGDALQLQQVVSNLIANAEQALSDHRGRRELTVTSSLLGDSVRITIADTGPGIILNHLDRVMEPMFTTRGARGHRGLGLTITHTIVRDHGGQIEVHSVPGEGACFTVSFPALPEGTPLDVPSRPESRARSVTPASVPAARDDDELEDAAPAVARGGHILLIEDEVTLRTAISRFLRTTGYTVQAVESGSAALDLLESHTFDLILLDLRMKGMTGEDVYETMQTTHSAQAQRVVFMTGDLHSAQASRFIRLTGRPVLAKPFTLTEMAGKIGQLIDAAAQG